MDDLGVPPWIEKHHICLLINGCLMVLYLCADLTFGNLAIEHPSFIDHFPAFSHDNLHLVWEFPSLLLWVEEVLHQLIWWFIPFIGFQPSKVVQDFATIHSMFDYCWVMHIPCHQVYIKTWHTVVT